MENVDRKVRRRSLKMFLSAAALPTTLLSSGCAEFFEKLADTCPENPEESGGVDWTPDVMHPVFYGYQDFSSDDGAPGNLRIWYPSYEGFTDGPPILKLCLVRWPLVLFLHGQPPCPEDGNYYKRWSLLPAVLARCGYVVVVPSHSAAFPGDANSAGEQYALNTLDWVRESWEHKKWVDARAEATGVVGHSYGALLAARVAAARPSISAFAGLSGPWLEFSNPLPVLQSINAPAFFMWGTGNPITAAFEDLDGGGNLWSQVPSPKYAGVFPGEHFDYLQTWSGCNFPKGDCSLIPAVAAELTALFLGRYLPVNLSQTQIPVNLDPPDVTLTQQQQFFAGAHLNGLQQIVNRSGCEVALRWSDSGQTGTRTLGPD